MCVPLVSSSLGVVWCLDDIMAVSTLTALPDNSAQVKTQLTLPRPSNLAVPHRPTTMIKTYNGQEWKSASIITWRTRTRRAGISWRKIRQPLSRYSPFRSFGSRPFSFMAARAQLFSSSSTKMVGGDSMAPPVCGGGGRPVVLLAGTTPLMFGAGGDGSASP